MTCLSMTAPSRVFNHPFCRDKFCTATYFPHNGMSQLLITGNATAGAYQQALRYVKYTVGDKSQNMGRRRSHPHHVLEAVRHGGHNLDLLSLGAGSELVHEDRLADQVLEERDFPGL